ANVVRILGLGMEKGISYVMLEYLSGNTLQDVLDRRGRLEPWEAIVFVYQALPGLHHMQEHGLTHGHLEPANLMGTEGPSRPIRYGVKILEPSLGRALGSAAALAAAPEYLAPEPAFDVRSDIFSLGCILYRCLTGQNPAPPQPLTEYLAEVPPGL